MGVLLPAGDPDGENLIGWNLSISGAVCVGGKTLGFGLGLGGGGTGLFSDKKNIRYK